MELEIAYSLGKLAPFSADGLSLYALPGGAGLMCHQNHLHHCRKATPNEIFGKNEASLFASKPAFINVIHNAGKREAHQGVSVTSV